MSYSTAVLAAFSGMLGLLHRAADPQCAIRELLPQLKCCFAARANLSEQILPEVSETEGATGNDRRLHAILPFPPILMVLAIQRAHAFSAEERFLFTQLETHLKAVIAQRAVAVDSQRATAGEAFVLTIVDGARPDRIPADVVQLLAPYYPVRPAKLTTLPAELWHWLRQQMASLAACGHSVTSRTQLLSRPGGCLRLRLTRATAPDTYLLEIREERKTSDFFQLRHLGLSERECEILFWISQGKRDHEIATVLDIAPKTVSKHVENTLRKLHAENRASAAHIAQDWLRREG